MGHPDAQSHFGLSGPGRTIAITQVAEHDPRLTIRGVLKDRKIRGPDDRVPGFAANGWD